MYWHCSAHINNTHVILLGGRESGFKAYIYNLNDFYQYYYGPDLSIERKGCAASQIIHTNGTAFIIIVGPDDSSEILNTDDHIESCRIQRPTCNNAGLKIHYPLLQDQHYLKIVLMDPW